MIDRPIEGVQTDQRAHPPGKRGATVSLREVAERAWKARMSPRLRAWVTQELDKAGTSRGTNKQKGQTILDAFRKKVPYIADPVMGEFMAKPEQVLCLDEGGLCIVGADCDEVSITLAASMMSIGIDAMIIGSSHREPYDTPTHVFMAFKNELDKWVKMDGTTNLPAGSVPPHMREFWFEPGEHAKDAGEGDFVGMSGPGTLAGTISGAEHRFNLRYPGIR